MQGSNLRQDEETHDGKNLQTAEEFIHFLTRKLGKRAASVDGDMPIDFEGYLTFRVHIQIYIQGSLTLAAVAVAVNS